MSRFTLCCAALAFASLTAMPAAADETASTKAFEQANAAMHHGMMITYTGDTDVDFVRGMIPHHQGAIDMAKVELAHGKDPETRKLAEDVIKAQTVEIDQMQAWLARHGKTETKAPPAHHPQ